MKKNTAVIIIIVLLIIFGIVFYLYYANTSKKLLDETLKHAEETMKLNSEISELKEKLENQENNQSEEKQTNNETKKDVKFDSSKMKSDSTNIRYEEKIDIGPTSAGLEIEIKDGKPFLTTNVENDSYKFFFPEVKEKVENKEITGFNQNVKKVYYAYMGNGDPCPIILFLMEDGSVEFLDSSKMLKNEQYKSQGKIKELSNIVKFIHVDAQELDENGEGMGGWITVVAINEDGYSFDLSASEAIQNNMLTNN